MVFQTTPSFGGGGDSTVLGNAVFFFGSRSSYFGIGSNERTNERSGDIRLAMAVSLVFRTYLSVRFWPGSSSYRFSLCGTMFVFLPHHHLADSFRYKTADEGSR